MPASCYTVEIVLLTPAVIDRVQNSKITVATQPKFYMDTGVSKV